MSSWFVCLDCGLNFRFECTNLLIVIRVYIFQTALNESVENERRRSCK